MSRLRVGDYEGGGRDVLPTGQYKFKVTDLKVVDGASGYCYPVLDVMVVGPDAQKEFYGKHIELGFSLAPTSVGAKPWLEALGFDEEDEIEVQDSSILEPYLKKRIKGAVVMANIEKGKDKSGQYDQNNVTPPWEVYPADLTETDYHDREPGDDGPN